MPSVMDPSQKPPPAADAGVCVIVPAHDFAGLPRFRDAWETQLARLGRPIEFHVVENPNLGAAIREGLTQTTQPLVLLLTPDYPFRPSDVRAYFDGLNEADMALGVRPSQTRPAAFDKLLKVVRWINRIIFGIDTGAPAAWYGYPAWRTRLWRRIRFGMRLQDPACGLRLVRRELLDRCPIQSDGAFALVEMIAKINFAGGTMIEVPLSKPSDLPTMAPFSDCPGDERSVFRRPVFRPASNHLQLVEMETKKPEEGHSSG
jgi:hypothetical protein